MNRIPAPGFAMLLGVTFFYVLGEAKPRTHPPYNSPYLQVHPDAPRAGAHGQMSAPRMSAPSDTPTWHNSPLPMSPPLPIPTASPTPAQRKTHNSPVIHSLERFKKLSPKMQEMQIRAFEARLKEMREIHRIKTNTK